MSRGTGSGTMSVREALKLPSFEGARVIAGQAGLDRNISNAMVIEACDIEKWAREGILLITSFFALEPLSHEGRVQFFDTLSRIGGSGIVFKPGRLFTEAPEEYVTLCEERDLPLVEVAGATKYESILMDVMGNVLDANLTLLNRFYSVHHDTMRLVLEHPSIYTILSELKKVLHSDVTLYSKAGNILEGTNDELSSFVSLSLSELKRGKYQNSHYFKARLAYKDRRELTAVSVAVPESDGKTTYLLVHANVEDLGPLDYMTIENYVNLLTTKLLEQAAVNQKMFNRNNVVVHDLLLNRYGTHAVVDEVLKGLGVDGYSLYQVLLLRLVITDKMQAERIHDILSVFEKRLRHRYSNIVFYENNDRTVFLRNIPSESHAFNPEVIRKMLDEMHEDPSLPDFSHLAAISDTCDRYSIGSINDQAISIYRLFNINRAANRIVTYKELGAFRLFVNLDDLSMVKDFIDPRIISLKEKSPDLYETLSALCETNLNYKETARRLFVHPKTIHYRVNRIQEVYGIDIHDSNDLMQALVAKKAYMLIDD